MPPAAPAAPRIAAQIDVCWGEYRGIERLIEDLKARHAKRIGVMGPISLHRFKKLEALFDMVLEENMTVVVQPNVITRDQMAGVQLGELVRITREGCVSMHTTPHGFLRLQG